MREPEALTSISFTVDTPLDMAYINKTLIEVCGLLLQCDGARAETRFRLSGETDESI
jgi:hypothetical protein